LPESLIINTLSWSIYSVLTSVKPNLNGIIITNGFHVFCVSLDFFVLRTFEFIWHNLPWKNNLKLNYLTLEKKRNERISSSTSVLSIATCTLTCLSNSLEAIRLNKW